MQKTRAGRWVALALAGAVALAGCSGTADDGNRAASPAQEEANGQSLDAAAFGAFVTSDEVTILDVRTPEEFGDGHLKGAANLDVSAADFTTQVANLDPGGIYAVYCRSGNRSQAAMTIMRDSGIGAVVDLVGGIEAWTQSGGDVVTGS